MTDVNSNYTMKSSRQPRSFTSEPTLKKKTKQSNENESEQSFKRRRPYESFSDKEDNVFDIFNQTDQILFDNDDESQSTSTSMRSSSPTDNKLRIQALIKKYIRTPSPTNSDVRLTMDALLDAVEALKSLSEVQTNRSQRTKKPRKSKLQHRIIPKTTNTNLFTSPSLDQSLSTSLPFVPLRPLSVSPPSVQIFESIPNDITIKPEEEEHPPQEIAQPNLMPTDTSLSNSPLRIQIPEENIWPSILSIHPSPESGETRKRRRSKTLSRNMRQSSSSSTIPIQNSIPTSDHTTEILFNDRQIRNDIQLTINNFNDQFQQLLVNLTSRIDTSLRTTRMKYEKDLEEIRQSYRLSLNELHSVTTEQVQDIHNSLELQYWKRLSEMRNRYESKLHYSLPFN